MRTITKSDLSPQPTMQQQRTPWHSPVPYLFGGLAAMLGLIAFALLILACSYWKLSGQLNESESNAQRDVENGGGDRDSADAVKTPKVYEEKILVIMAGHDKPTFLATPASMSAWVGDGSGNEADNKEDEKSDNKVKKEEDHQEQMTTRSMEHSAIEERQQAGDQSV